MKTSVLVLFALMALSFARTPKSRGTKKSRQDNPGGGPTSTAALPASSGVTSNGKVTLPAGCESINGIGIGWLPDADKGVPLSSILGPLGDPLPCFVGYYSHITSTSYDGSQITSKVADIKAAGKNGAYPIFITSVMPDIPFSQVPSVADQIGNVMNQITSQGLTVWLRFAHEMNWYVQPGSGSNGDSQYHGSSDDFQTAWAAVSQAVSSNPKVLMYWSPNQADDIAGLKSEWYPKSGAVDVVGIDVYPKPQEDFQSAYGSFCQSFSDKPFAVGETAQGDDSGAKVYWLQQLTSPDAKSACPQYVGFSWFEYDKEKDFDVVTNGNTEALQVLKGSS